MRCCGKVLTQVNRQFIRGSRTFFTATVNSMPIKEGDRLPNIEVLEKTPNTKVNLGDLFKGKKGVLFGVPGAFTPGCSKTHLPGYVQNFDKLKAKGMDVVACIAVNDPFVMDAWGENQGANGKIRMLADYKGEFAKAADLEKDLTGALGSVRCKRFSMVVEDGVVKKLNVEPDGTGLTCSLADNVLSQL
ncbi:peroxiredoxin-5, mitochondrial-like [Lingula anatina]|uniref:Peroxiredoxin-5 n=1 Tax=Lingula anatina TaxID=7574 RepID=A0A1S3HMC0_LINAN|nr:peroxiredoxin-5, mitochondrial-like [Lingula anatina]|eukprot:XP_013386184.1 peroxiredoxin-5, mitochondrial-like [Lingula anatina]